MANNTETSTWEAGIYQFETSDPIQGGPGGVDNLPHVQLGNRTKWLNDNKVGIAGSWTLGGSYSYTGTVTFANSNPIRFGDSGGTAQALLTLNSSNVAYVGDVYAAIPGSTAVLRASSTVQMVVGSTPVLLADVDGPRLNSALSGADNSLKLVSSSWVRAYAAPVDAPTFTGVPAAPTAAVDTSSTQLATTAFVLNQRATTTTPSMNGSAAVGTSLRWARADHVHPTDTTRAPVNSPTFTGAPKAPTPASNDNSTNIATTAWARALVDSVFSSQSLAQTGYQTLPGGLILQWGRSTTTANPSSVSFPIAFPNACFVVVPVTRRNAPFFQAVAVWNESQNGFDSYHDSAGVSFAWVAIGN